MASGGDQHLGLNHVGVHAHLCVMVQGHQGPVGYGTTHVASTDWILTNNQVLTGCSIEELDIGGLHRQDQISRSVVQSLQSGQGCSATVEEFWRCQYG